MPTVKSIFTYPARVHKDRLDDDTPMQTFFDICSNLADREKYERVLDKLESEAEWAYKVITATGHGMPSKRTFIRAIRCFETAQLDLARLDAASSAAYKQQAGYLDGDEKEAFETALNLNPKSKDEHRALGDHRNMVLAVFRKLRSWDGPNKDRLTDDMGLSAEPPRTRKGGRRNGGKGRKQLAGASS